MDLGTPGQLSSFAVDNHWVSVAGSQLYLNGQYISDISKGLGAVAGNHMLIVAAGEELLLLRPTGELIERIPWESIDKSTIQSIGQLANGNVVVRSSQRLWLADAQLLNWTLLEDTINTPVWSSPKPAPKTVLAMIRQHYQGDGLSLERIVLDLHSGRIFGPIGTFAYDLMALVVGFLAISGMVLWFRGRRNSYANTLQRNKKH